MARSWKRTSGFDGMSLVHQTRAVSNSARDMGKRVSRSDYDTYGERLSVFRTWFDTHVMALQKSPDTLMILQMETEDPIYRGELQR